MKSILAAGLSVVIAALTAFVALPDHSIGTDIQFGALVASSLVTWFAPLVKGIWPDVLKTGLAIVLAVVGALVPLLQNGGHLTATQWIIVGLAGLNALAVHIGVAVRVSAAKAALAADPKAVGFADQAALRIITVI